jgi:hypothetical protein
MVEAISSWVTVCLATEALHQIREKRKTFSKELEEMATGPFPISLAEVHKAQNEFSAELDIVEKQALHLGGARTAPMEDYYEQKFPLNLRGWKYQKRLEKARIERRVTDAGGDWLFDNLYDPITVVLYRKLRNSKDILAGATWKLGFLTFWGIPAYLFREREFKKYVSDTRRMVRHELQHLSQDLLRVLTDVESAGGSLAQKVTLKAPYSLEQQLKEHALRDVEFPTRLRDDIENFLELAPTMTNLREAIHSFVGDAPAKNGVHVSSFFSALKEYDQKKWRRAVREFTRAVRVSSFENR